MSKLKIAEIKTFLLTKGFSFTTETQEDGITYYAFNHPELDDIFIHYLKEHKCWSVSSSFWALMPGDFTNTDRLYWYIEGIKGYILNNF